MSLIVTDSQLALAYLCLGNEHQWNLSVLQQTLNLSVFRYFYRSLHVPIESINLLVLCLSEIQVLPKSLCWCPSCSKLNLITFGLVCADICPQNVKSLISNLDLVVNVADISASSPSCCSVLRKIDSQGSNHVYLVYTKEGYWDNSSTGIVRPFPKPEGCFT